MCSLTPPFPTPHSSTRTHTLHHREKAPQGSPKAGVADGACLIATLRALVRSILTIPLPSSADAEPVADVDERPQGWSDAEHEATKGTPVSLFRLLCVPPVCYCIAPPFCPCAQRTMRRSPQKLATTCCGASARCGAHGDRFGALLLECDKLGRHLDPPSLSPFSLPLQSVRHCGTTSALGLLLLELHQLAAATEFAVDVEPLVPGINTNCPVPLSRPLCVLMSVISPLSQTSSPGGPPLLAPMPRQHLTRSKNAPCVPQPLSPYLLPFPASAP